MQTSNNGQFLWADTPLWSERHTKMHLKFVFNLPAQLQESSTTRVLFLFVLECPKPKIALGRRYFGT